VTSRRFLSLPETAVPNQQQYMAASIFDQDSRGYMPFRPRTDPRASMASTAFEKEEVDMDFD
jgi:hypothetical protein